MVGRDGVGHAERTLREQKMIPLLDDWEFYGDGCLWGMFTAAPVPQGVIVAKK